MFTYFNNLDKKVNETLTLYSEIGKMSKPIFNYALVLVSILIMTSCFSIIYSLNYNSSKPENETDIKSNKYPGNTSHISWSTHNN